MNKEYNLLHILKTLGKWKKQIIRTTLLAAVLSIIGSLLMPNYYKATTVLYAASPTLANPDPVGGGEKNFFIYGSGEDMDRLFSIANSVDVKNHLIEIFDLADHYDIDAGTPKGRAKLMKKLIKLYQTKKTKYDGLELSIEDTDPQLAKEMVTKSREYIAGKSENIIKESQKILLSALQNGIDHQETQLKILSDSLTRLKNAYGIYESYAQAKALAEISESAEANLISKKAMVDAMVKFRMPRDSVNKIRAKVAGAEGLKKAVEDKIKRFNDGVLSIRQMEVAQNKMVEELALQKERYKKLKAIYEKSIPTVHVIEKEEVPNEKSRPKRSLIVFGITLLAFVLSSLMVLLIESTKDVEWKKIYAGE